MPISSLPSKFPPPDLIRFIILDSGPLLILYPLSMFELSSKEFELVDIFGWRWTVNEMWKTMVNEHEFRLCYKNLTKKYIVYQIYPCVYVFEFRRRRNTCENFQQSLMWIFIADRRKTSCLLYTNIIRPFHIWDIKISLKLRSNLQNFFPFDLRSR